MAIKKPVVDPMSVTASHALPTGHHSAQADVSEDFIGATNAKQRSAMSTSHGNLYESLPPMEKLGAKANADDYED